MEPPTAPNSHAMESIATSNRTPCSRRRASSSSAPYETPASSSSTLSPESVASSSAPSSEREPHTEINTISNTNEVVLTKKICPYCDFEFKTFQNGRRHVFQAHGLRDLPAKAMSGFRPLVYNSSNLAKYTNQGKTIVVKFACISCPMAFEEKAELARHVDCQHVFPTNMSMDELPAGDHWLIGDEDMTLKFYDYRCMCLDTIRSATPMTLHTQFNELLAVSGILVLQRRNYYESLPVDTFGPGLLQAARASVLARFDHSLFDHAVQSKIQVILSNYVEDEWSGTKTRLELLTLCEAPSTNAGSRSVLLAIEGLLAFLPAKIAHCSNLIPDDLEHTANRPDYKVGVYASSGYGFAYTNAFGEVKRSPDISPTLLVKDFYRLCRFAKDAIDQHNLANVLTFQAVGSVITFFVMSLLSPHVYTMTEVKRIRLPTKKSDALDLVGHLGDLLFVADLFRNHCIPSLKDLKAWTCPTLSPLFLEDTTLSPRKRPFDLTLDN
ncbi:hypothetical protein DM01DRAFT_1316184 [Hesseltinella vesiculosa]|uniref:C2H2-type domain-containing protein n=1 Tax=Hesseltinella vesiculosa TaxID=101127 RepID=A0A1X2GTU0_9FUNG|nr:hypothetical protein DM01DRAFT_1316184 [Hesseltinella vesiculosa]